MFYSCRFKQTQSMLAGKSLNFFFLILEYLGLTSSSAESNFRLYSRCLFFYFSELHVTWDFSLGFFHINAYTRLFPQILHCPPIAAQRNKCCFLHFKNGHKKNQWQIERSIKMETSCWYLQNIKLKKHPLLTSYLKTKRLQLTYRPFLFLRTLLI